MTLSKDKDGFAKVNGQWIQPEEVKAIESGDIENHIESTLKERAENKQLGKLNTLSDYYDKVVSALGFDIDVYEIRNKYASNNFKIKDLGFKLG